MCKLLANGVVMKKSKKEQIEWNAINFQHAMSIHRFPFHDRVIMGAEVV